MLRLALLRIAGGLRHAPRFGTEIRGAVDRPRPGWAARAIDAAWFGLVAGLLELGFLVVRKLLYTEAALGAIQMNRHYLWMIPTATLALFLAWGVVVDLAGRLSPGGRARSALPAHLFLALLTLMLAVQRLHPVACLVLSFGAAYRLGPWLADRAAGFDRLARWSLPGLLGIVCVLGGVSYHRVALAEQRALASLPAPPPGASNVILIVLDTVRADHLSLYGYERATTPNLARLARRGVRLDRARSTAPWTLPSHASMFTGRWPCELFSRQHQPMGPQHPTLAAFLRDRGYLTAGFVANTYYCNHWFGLSRGFDHYEDDSGQELVVTPGTVLRASDLGKKTLQLVDSVFNVGPGPSGRRKDAARVNDEFLTWLSASAKEQPGRPFFAFLNYLDAHAPYFVPDRSAPPFGIVPTTPADQAVLANWDVSDKRNVPEHAVTLARDSYDDCLAYLDAQLGLLFDELDRRGVFEDTMIIVTSDHGEHFGEHPRLYSHAQSLYRPELDVPLLVVAPRKVPAGITVDDPVSLRDLPATVLHWLALDSQSPFPGQPLSRHWDLALARTLPEPEPIFSESSLGPKGINPKHAIPALRGPLSALLTERHSYIRTEARRQRHEELYDLTTDPDETRNLVGMPEAKESLEVLRLLRADPARGALAELRIEAIADHGATASKRERFRPLSVQARLVACVGPASESTMESLGLSRDFGARGTMRIARYSWVAIAPAVAMVVMAGTSRAADRPVPGDDWTFRPTVIVRKGRAQGSGTLIASVAGETLVLTAAHVVADRGPLRVELHRYNLGLERNRGRTQARAGWPRSFAAEVVAADEAADLAMLRIEGLPPLPYVARLAVQGTDPARGTVVTSVGIDLGTRLSSWATRIAAIDRFEIEGGGDERFFLITVKAPEHGRSGGGLFLADGRLVGVCVGRAEIARGRKESGVFASSSSIRRFLRAHDLDAGIVPTAARRPAPIRTTRTRAGR